MQRRGALSIFPSLISSLGLMASMNDALMAESIDSINTVDPSASFDVLVVA